MEEIKLILPDSWETITLSQFQEYHQYLRNNEDEITIKKIITLLSILTDTDEDIFYKMSMDTIYEIQDNIEFMSEEPKPENFKNIIEIDGIKYGFQKDLHKLSLGEWIDLEHYVTNGDIIDNLHYIVAILYRKLISEGDEYFDYEIEEYKDVKLEGRAKLFKYNASISDVYSVSVFFWILGNEFLNSMNYFSTEMTMEEKIIKMISRIKDIKLRKKLMLQIEKSQLKNSTGNSYSTDFLMGILQNMTES
jgi:hypothetical protein